MLAWPQDMTLPAAIGGVASALALIVWLQRAKRKRAKEARERELEDLRRR